MKIEIIDNQDDWMNIKINGELWYEGHMSSFHNFILKELLDTVLPDAEIIHDDNPENFDRE
jgi:hypothetical protein